MVTRQQRALSGIRFGSDGYRGVIGEDFTWQRVSRLAAATAKYLHNAGAPKDSVIPIGYDTRFLALQYARAVYGALRQEGFQPCLAATPCPSPYLSFAVRRFEAPLGIMLTASHNPARYLGFKLKGPEGGSALPEVNQAVERLAGEDAIEFGFASAFARTTVYEQFDLRADYEDAIRGYAAVQLAELPLSVNVDFMYGSTGYVYLPVLRTLLRDFTPIHHEPDPCFGGGKPEPISEQLDELVGWVEARSGSCGAAFDGDGDRLGLIDEDGVFVPPEDIYAICLLHLVEDRGMRGRVIKSVSFSSLVDRVATELGLDTVEVPVGFKHSTERMLEPGALMAAEESGGFGFAFHLPERDALLTLVIVLSALAQRKLNLRQLRSQLAARFGRPCFRRLDVPLAGAAQREVLQGRLEQLKTAPSLAGVRATSTSDLDGVKLNYPGGFLLLRLSGTEPLLRIYCEHTSEEGLRATIDRAQRFLLAS